MTREQMLRALEKRFGKEWQQPPQLVPPRAAHKHDLEIIRARQRGKRRFY